MQQSFFLVHIAPFFRGTLFLPYFMGGLGVIIYLQMSLNYIAGAPLEFILLGFMALIISLTRCTFSTTKVRISLLGFTLKEWGGELFTTRPEKKLHRLFEKNPTTGEMKALPLLLSQVPDCLYEWKDVPHE
jgi:hypothetical protein